MINITKVGKATKRLSHLIISLSRSRITAAVADEAVYKNDFYDIQKIFNKFSATLVITPATLYSVKFSYNILRRMKAYLWSRMGKKKKLLNSMTN